MNLLLDKLDAIALDATSLLTGEDRKACDGLQVDYNQMIAHLRFIEGGLERVRQGLAIENLEKISGSFSAYRWHMKNELHELSHSIKELKADFACAVLRYFATQYTLSLDERQFIDDCAKDFHLITPENFRYEFVVDWIFRRAGGNLTNLAYEQLVAEVHERTGWKNRTTLRSEVIEFTNHFAIVDICSIMGNRLGYGSDVTLLDRMITYANTGKTGNLEYLSSAMRWVPNRKIDRFPFTLKLAENPLLSSIRLFKNKRVDLIFCSAQKAREFYDLFRLEETDKPDKS